MCAQASSGKMADPSKRAGDATPLSMRRGLMVVLTLAQIIPTAFGFHTSAVFHPGPGRTGRRLDSTDISQDKRLLCRRRLLHSSEYAASLRAQVGDIAPFGEGLRVLSMREQREHLQVLQSANDPASPWMDSAPSWSDLALWLSDQQTEDERRWKHNALSGRGPANSLADIRLFDAPAGTEPRVTLFRDTAAWCPYCQKVGCSGAVWCCVVLCGAVRCCVAQCSAEMPRSCCFLFRFPLQRYRPAPVVACVL